MSKIGEGFEHQIAGAPSAEEASIKKLRKNFAVPVKELSEVRTWPSLVALASDWLMIVGAIGVSQIWPHPLLYFAAVLIVAGRQHALLVLVHEAAHMRLSKNATLNDFLSDTFAAIPTFFDTHMYRLHHSKHHRFLNSDADPDWVRKKGRPQWTFPIQKRFVAKTYPKFVVWNGSVEWSTLSLIFSGILPLQTILKGHQRLQFIKRAVFYSLAAALFTATGVWSQFFMYWLIPLFFVFPSFQRMRSVAEHFGLKCEHELNSSRNILAPWYETLFFAPHSVNYHLVHHMFPAVPFYNLKHLNGLLMQDEDYRRLAHQNTSYLVPTTYPLTKDLLENSNTTPTSDPAKSAA